jgi:Right handed beta helix region
MWIMPGAKRRLHPLPAVLCSLAAVSVLIVAAFLFTNSACRAQEQEPTVRFVPAEANLQQAIDDARPGDTLVLQAGAYYGGNFVLRAKEGAQFITIQTSALESLPPENHRVSPEHAQWMAMLIAPNTDPVVRTEEGAHHYRFVGIEFRPAAGIYTYGLIQFGSINAISADQQPHDLELDRVYVHGDPQRGGKRGLELQSRSTTIRNSYFSDFKSDFQDAQAIAGSNGPGPYVIFNNRLEASGMSVIFGGNAPKIPDLIPSDIVFYNNYITRPLDWRGKASVKNLFELKNARNVDVRYNLFENNWVSSQSGTAILFTVRTCEAGDYPWAAIENVNFSNNVVRKSEGGGVVMMSGDDVRVNCATPGSGQVTAAGTAVVGQDTSFTSELKVGQYLVINKVARRIVNIADDSNLTVSSRFSAEPVGPTSFRYFSRAGRVDHITISDNLFEDIRPFDGSSGGGRLFQIYYGVQNVTIERNTGFQSGPAVIADGWSSPGFVFRDNIVLYNRLGILGNGKGSGLATLDFYFPGSVVTNNVLIGGGAFASRYPAGNFFPASIEEVGFLDAASSNYGLSDHSPYKRKGPDERDLGADMNVLSQVIQEAVSGAPAAEGPALSALRRFTQSAESHAWKTFQWVRRPAQ